MKCVEIFSFVAFALWTGDIDCAQWMAMPQNSDLVSLSAVNEIRMRSSIHCATSCNQTAQCVTFIFAQQEHLNCQLLDTFGLGTSSQPSTGARFFTKKMNNGETDGDGYRMVEYSEGLYIYKIHTVAAVLNDAHSICASEGAHLLRLTSTAKLSSMKTIILSSPEYSSFDGFHVDGSNVGASNYLDKTQWFFSNGDQLPIELWISGLPNNAGASCAWMWTNLGFDLDDWGCGSNAQFICEKPI